MFRKIYPLFHFDIGSKSVIRAQAVAENKKILGTKRVDIKVVVAITQENILFTEKTNIKAIVCHTE